MCGLHWTKTWHAILFEQHWNSMRTEARCRRRTQGKVQQFLQSIYRLVRASKVRPKNILHFIFKLSPMILPWSTSIRCAYAFKHFWKPNPINSTTSYRQQYPTWFSTKNQNRTWRYATWVIRKRQQVVEKRLFSYARKLTKTTLRYGFSRIRRLTQRGKHMDHLAHRTFTSRLP